MMWAKKVLILMGDVVALYAALFLALAIRYGTDNISVRLNDHIGPFSIIFPLWILIFYLANLYHAQSIRNRNILLKNLVVSILIALLISTIVFYLFGAFFELTPKTNLLIFGGGFLLIGFALRSATLGFFASTATPIIILGETPLVGDVVKLLEGNPHSGYVLALQQKDLSPKSLDVLSEEIEKRKIELVVIAEPRPTKEVAGIIVQKFLPKEVAIMNFWDFYELVFEQIPLEEVEESWFLENITTRRPIYDSLKRTLDFFLGVLLSVLLLPLAIIIAILIKATSAGPAIFSQSRDGKNNIKFNIYKFRTMNGENGPLWTEKNDSRLTTFGKFLRFTHLDEIPQLINLIKGDISLTGPRPERVELAEQYRQLPYYDMRHVVKPGLTGWAQINYKPSVSIEEAYKKLRYDIYYIKNRSFWLDLRIIIRTIRYFFDSQ